MSGFPFLEVFIGLGGVVCVLLYAWSLDEIGRLKKTIAEQQGELEAAKRKQQEETPTLPALMQRERERWRA
jgi:hypothetical protein